MSANKTNIALLTVFILILASLVTLFLKTIPLTLAKAVYFCQKTFLSSAVILPHSATFSLLILLLFVFSAGLLVLIIQIVKTRFFLKEVIKDTVSLPRKLQLIAKNLKLKNKIDLIENDKPVSFCYGLLSPRICVSTGLIKSLTRNELKAVLLHERYHVENHDPLRIILGKTASLMLFFIPVLRDIEAHYIFSKEVTADEMAIQRGDKKSLVSALKKLLSPNTPSFYGIAAFASTDDLERRILHLTNRQGEKTINIKKRNLVLSTGILLTLFAVINAPVHAISMSETSMQSMSQSYFVCPFGGDCINSCKKDFELSNKNNFSKDLPYTPVK